MEAVEAVRGPRRRVVPSDSRTTGFSPIMLGYGIMMATVSLGNRKFSVPL